MIRHTHNLFVIFLIATLASLPALAGPQDWNKDFETAKKTAASERKDILLKFTGSDWCSPSKELNRTVFSKEVFKNDAEDKFVLLKLDFSLQTRWTRVTHDFVKTYNIKNFPTVILADASGRPYAQTGLRREGAEAYGEHLDKLRLIKQSRDAAFMEAAKAEGIEKAKHLDKALEAVSMTLVMMYYTDTVEQIIKIDTDNEAGLRAKYEGLLKKHHHKQKQFEKVQNQLDDIRKNMYDNPAAKIELIDTIVQEKVLPAQIKQEALHIKASIYGYALQRHRASLAILNEAVTAAPSTPRALWITREIQQLEKFLDLDF